MSNYVHYERKSNLCQLVNQVAHLGPLGMGRDTWWLEHFNKPIAGFKDEIPTFTPSLV